MIDLSQVHERVGHVDETQDAVRSLTHRRRGGLLLVEGPSCSGRSRAVAAATALASSRGASVAARAATGLDGDAGFSTALATLRSAPGTAALSDGLSAVAADRLHVADQLRDRMGQHSLSRPLVVAVDDVDLADDSTLFVLPYLIDALADHPVLWVLSRRVLPATDPLGDDLDRRATWRVALGPLSRTGVHDLCVAVAGAPPGPDLLALVRGVGGDPYYADHLVRALHDEGRLVRVDGRSAIGPAGGAHRLPDGFLQAVERRLSRLSGGARRLLAAASVVERPTTRHVMAALTDAGSADSASACDEAMAAGVLCDGPDGVLFCHDVVREAVYVGLGESARSALHRDTADVLRGEGAEPEETARHAVRGRHRCDDAMIPVLIAAVRSAGTRSAADAAEFGERALDLIDGPVASRTGPPSDDTVELTAETVRQLAHAGRLQRARDLGAGALARVADARQESVLLLDLVPVLHEVGESVLAGEYAQRALARTALPEPYRTELEALVAGTAPSDRPGHEGDRTRAVVVGAAAAAVAARAAGRFEQSVRLARRAVRAADAVRPARSGLRLRYRPRLVLAACLVDCDRFRESAAVAALCREEIDQGGDASAALQWRAIETERLIAEGSLDEAARVAGAEPRRGVVEQADPTVVGLLSAAIELGVRRGDLGAARRSLDLAVPGACRADESTRLRLMWRSVLLHEAAGDRRRAVRTAAGIAATPSMVATTAPLGALPTFVRHAVLDGASDRAGAFAGLAAALAGQNPGVRSLQACAAHVAGLVHRDTDRLRAAVDLYRGCPRPGGLVAAIEDLAHAERRDGRLARADELFAEAARVWEAIGARADHHRVRQALDDEGGSTPDSREPNRWEELTGAELKVVREVAQGKTNKEVAAALNLSRHTVDSHLRRSFAKVEVNSRVELTRLFIQNYEAVKTAG